MALAIIAKDPEAVEVYGIDWTKHMISGDSIATSQWTAPTGITIADQSFAGLTAKVKVSGGTRAQSYLVTNRITTTPGAETLELSLLVQIGDK